MPGGVRPPGLPPSPACDPVLARANSYLHTVDEKAYTDDDLLQVVRSDGIMAGHPTAGWEGGDDALIFGELFILWRSNPPFKTAGIHGVWSEFPRWRWSKTGCVSISQPSYLKVHLLHNVHPHSLSKEIPPKKYLDIPLPKVYISPFPLVTKKIMI